MIAISLRLVAIFSSKNAENEAPGKGLANCLRTLNPCQCEIKEIPLQDEERLIQTRRDAHIHVLIVLAK
jgi:hypothetical protein